MPLKPKWLPINAKRRCMCALLGLGVVVLCCVVLCCVVSCCVVLWLCGVLWCCGVVVLWCCGVAVLRCCGVAVLRCCVVLSSMVLFGSVWGSIVLCCVMLCYDVL